MYSVCRVSQKMVIFFISMDMGCTSYKMETGPDNKKIVTSNPDCFHREAKVKSQRLVEVTKIQDVESDISNHFNDPNRRYISELPR